jgi:hypothetical protein
MDATVESSRDGGDTLVAAAEEIIAQAWLCGLENPPSGNSLEHLAKELCLEPRQLENVAVAFGENRFLELAFAGPVDGPPSAADVFDTGTSAGPMTRTCGTCACGTNSCGTCHCGTGTCGTCLC